MLHPKYMKSTYERGVLTCRKCGSPIYVHRLRELADEISVRCNQCGDRGIYPKRALAIQSVPERRKKPRR